MSSTTKKLAPNGKLSEHFILAELVKTNMLDYHHKNAVYAERPEVMLRLWGLVNLILEPIRVNSGPTVITSGVRCPELNAAIGGAATSQHLSGEAVDITIPGTKLEDVMLFCWNSDLPIGQCILEENQRGDRWIHVSFARPGKKNRDFMVAEYSVIHNKMIYRAWEPS